ncbi:MAG: hypothetical protein D8M58_13540 [Calditrichaeota bacterium]|nr:MAG: hypothetical protein DWQ03_00505 [Calditrichota bacterium]MBL1206422.1 hypothetical protein [Calditrichota bacterium]NOG46248.1 hypothetical protein [Calditrichota bacterium]
MRIYFLVFVFFLIIITCSESTGPPPKNGPDTTSHNFVWQIDTFKAVNGQNTFRDVFAISEDNVWTIGTIYVDSTDGFGLNVLYNAAHWDGLKWNLKQFKYNSDGFITVMNPLRAIWYFSDDNIWLGGGSIFHFDGNIASLIHRPNLENYESVEHLWAASENEIYAVGTKGLILKYNGSSWTKMNSGTTMDFQDIWGRVDEETGQVEVWAGAYDLSTDRHGIILKCNGTEWETLFDKDNNIYQPDWDHTVPTAVWALKDSIYFALAGTDSSKIVRHNRMNFLSYLSPHTEDQGSIQAFHGNEYNDFFAVGFRDLVLHYNGSTFKSYFPDRYIEGFYNSVQQVGNSVFIVGFNPGSDDALILTGKRQ